MQPLVTATASKGLVSPVSPCAQLARTISFPVGLQAFLELGSLTLHDLDNKGKVVAFNLVVVVLVIEVVVVAQVKYTILVAIPATRVVVSI